MSVTWPIFVGKPTPTKTSSPMYNAGFGVVDWHSRAGSAQAVMGDWYFVAEQPAPALNLARLEGRATLMHIC